jgi:hypothetical protein
MLSLAGRIYFEKSCGKDNSLFIAIVIVKENYFDG